MATLIRPKYQIFISSTFDDLRDEREHVSWELLKLRHIPAGMENFTAKDERGWKTIARTIEDSDYYVLILAGRYGSIDSTLAKSWTHHEYDYALSKGIPILAFIRDLDTIPGNKLDADRTHIDSFRASVKNTRLCSFWKHKDDLAKTVGTALTTQIADDIADGSERLGWFRGDVKPSISPEVAEELARLSAENSALRQELAKLQALASTKLEIAGADGQLISGYSQIHKRLIFAEDRNDSMRNIGLALSGTPRDEDYEEFLERRTKTLWLDNIYIANKGTTAALDIVVEIKITDVYTIADSLEPIPSMYPTPTTRRNSSLAHVYIDSIKFDQTSAAVRQRIKSIAPGVTEQLVPLALTGPDSLNAGVHEHNFQIEIKATDHTGSHCAGIFPARLLIQGGEYLNTKKIRERFE